MAPVAAVLSERRRDRRCALSDTRWEARAVLRPGVPVTLLDICPRAALVESEVRLRPGALTEMQLTGGGARVTVRGRLDRCYVAALTPLRYRGVLMFEQTVEIG